MDKGVKAKEAAHGQKMIEVKIRFWTNDIAGKGAILPKHAWDAGVVRMERNGAHGISPVQPVPFNGMAELQAKIEKVLIEHGIVLHLGTRSRKYIKGKGD